ncbi:hypothetical protein SBOR_1195 [Sclerotinia borealis F-4128]|uniref:Uncharacterized protein n=1 Tax=Sclerotinia borealis (strain F-4128) TaxID=1432307 RepID=W9CUZ6_SCLBF|nr:hypothetical protein SBOR_1195 [Sclerotinia borealis F-4128]
MSANSASGGIKEDAPASSTDHSLLSQTGEAVQPAPSTRDEGPIDVPMKIRRQKQPQLPSIFLPKSKCTSKFTPAIIHRNKRAFQALNNQATLNAWKFRQSHLSVNDVTSRNLERGSAYQKGLLANVTDATTDMEVIWAPADFLGYGVELQIIVTQF